MKFASTSTPVVVVNCQLAALAIMRSLGPLGVPLYGVDRDPSAPGLLSRYCRTRFVLKFSEDDPEPFLRGLLDIARQIGTRAILIATSDETTQFVADHADALREHFLFQDNSPALVRRLASKREMFDLAIRHGVPTPKTEFPQHLDDVVAYAARGPFPVMLKGIYGNRLQLRTKKKMAIVSTPQELLEAYRLMEDPDQPNLMLQELIPGGDDQVYIFNGYFDVNAECVVGFTGFKVRQFPVHVGCASLGECRTIEEVAAITTRFMREVGYRGILDIGYRLDPRDGLYKVLDINPRVGQAFRLFVAENDHDVVKALYLDFTAQQRLPAVPREGRRWLIEDYDLISSVHYRREGALGVRQWVRSFAGVEEAAWFDRRDVRPFFLMCRRLATRAAVWLAKRAGLRRARNGQAPAPLSLRDRVKGMLRAAVSIEHRKRLALFVQRRTWLSEARRNWWALELVRDLGDSDVDALHRFLWSHHIGYASTYEVTERFGAEKMKLSRQMFFARLRERLTGRGISPERDVHSVLEVGCSLGYQLRFMETELFPRAAILDGLDIDQYAIEAGSAHLRAAGSRVALGVADLGDLDAVLADRQYDVIVCTGVLMYLNEERAAAAVGSMLRHGRLVAFAGLAHPASDNAVLPRSDVRARDTTFIHNLDRMIERAGGAVVGRQWEGERDFEGNSVYFVFATPGPTRLSGAAVRTPVAASA